MLEPAQSFLRGNCVGNIDGKAILDLERRRPLSVVSSEYRLVTNKKALEFIAPVASRFFGGNGIRDFECFNILCPKTRSYCRVDLTRRESCEFTINGDKYIAFIRISNSYNRFCRLTMTIGFCRWICLNGCIFGEHSYTFSVTHNDRRLTDSAFIDKIASEAMKKVGSLADTKREFIDAASVLLGIAMTREQMRALFCLVNGIKLDEDGARTLTDEKREHLVAINNRLSGLIDSYSSELGPSAYAAFNVLTDWASYPSGNSDAVVSPGRQQRVGEWLEEFSIMARRGGFNLNAYLETSLKSQEVLGRIKDLKPNLA